MVSRVLCVFTLIIPTFAQNITCHTTVNSPQCVCPSDVTASICTLRCDGYQSCKQHDIVCRDGADCILHCEEQEACSNVTVQCPANARCIIHCHGGIDVCSQLVVRNSENSTEYALYTPAPTTKPPTPYGHQSVIPDLQYNGWQPLISFDAGRNLFGCVVAYSDTSDIIYFLGGDWYDSGRSLISYHIYNHTFVDHGAANLSSGLELSYSSQGYTQLRQFLFFTQYGDMDMEIHRFNARNLIIKLRTQAASYLHDECLTSATINGDDYLFVINDDSVNSLLEIYALSNKVWTSSADTPPLIQSRFAPACAVGANGFLYVIGGGTGTVETLDIKSFLEGSDASWEQLADRLSEDWTHFGRALSYFTDILYFAGRDINVINTIDDTISVKGTLPFSLGGQPVIIVPFSDNLFRMYAADTWSIDNGLQLYYMDLPRSETGFPTTTPTAAPTAFPSVSPSSSPTATPTASPTASPSLSPSLSPTQPSGAPTTATMTPTASPTVSPTSSPTISYDSYLNAEYGLSTGVKKNLFLYMSRFSGQTSFKTDRPMEKTFF